MFGGSVLMIFGNPVLRSCLSSSRTHAANFAGTSTTACRLPGGRAVSGRPALLAPAAAHTRAGQCGRDGRPLRAARCCTIHSRGETAPPARRPPPPRTHNTRPLPGEGGHAADCLRGAMRLWTYAFLARCDPDWRAGPPQPASSTPANTTRTAASAEIKPKAARPAALRARWCSSAAAAATTTRTLDRQRPAVVAVHLGPVAAAFRAPGPGPPT